MLCWTCFPDDQKTISNLFCHFQKIELVTSLFTKVMELRFHCENIKH